MVLTGLVAVIWVYFGRLYLIHDPDEWRIANQQLGYPGQQRPSGFIEEWQGSHKEVPTTGAGSQ